MASQYWIERDRGIKESAQQLAVLRKKCPLGFPTRDQEVRPLAIGVGGAIADEMGWSFAHTRGVLPVYCQAVLRHDQRFRFIL
jgi:hypothetical protein